METQRIEYIKIADLVLWTENPRDPISTQSNDQDILNIALGEHHSKWELKKLAEQMGGTYDFSELPTVVYHGKTPVVYDGNRRVLLGKIQKKFVSHELVLKWKLPLFPDEIPCNVCEKKVALANVLRKHGDSGSWLPLERDIFLHRHMKYDKSLFLIIEEQTNMISQYSYLNQRCKKLTRCLQYFRRKYCNEHAQTNPPHAIRPRGNMAFIPNPTMESDALGRTLPSESPDHLFGTQKSPLATICAE